MRNDDQWFEPGDKVMRVSRKDGSPDEYPHEAIYDAQEGKVYCVESCWPHEVLQINVMRLVGMPREYNVFGNEVPFRCFNFRKVEEIQLCVRAAEAMKTPKKQEELV